MLSELMEWCESSRSVVRAHGVLLDALAAAGSFLKARTGQVSMQEGQQIRILSIS